MRGMEVLLTGVRGGGDDRDARPKRIAGRVLIM